TGAPDPQQGPDAGQQPPYGQPTPPPYGQPQAPQYQYGQQAPQQQYGQQAPQQQYGQQGTMLPPDQERFYAGAAHWGALIAGFVSGGFLAWLVPLLIMQLKGPASPLVRRQAVESLNFQISMIIWLVVAGVLLIVFIGFLLLPLVAIWWLVFTIIG